tara:strand:+ start:2904 stop:3620 length:717 start_codon:yes stop_codon:yes gene_type:complete
MINKYTKNQLRNQFYFDGYNKVDISQSLTFKKIKRFLYSKNNLNLSSSKYWFEKYKRTYDLHLKVILEQEIFIEFLEESKIINYLEKISGFKYQLGDLVVRKTYLKEGYTSWHRDTYLNKGKLVGRNPPLIKLILYPKLNNNCVQLKLKPGTHLNFNKNRYFDLFKNILKPQISIKTSNEEALIFNSSIYHKTSPPENNGSFRVIYNFCAKDQIKDFTNSPIINEYRKNLRNKKNIYF